MANSFFSIRRSSKPTSTGYVLALFVMAAQLCAQEQHWINPAGGDFDDPTNWNASVPAATDKAIFDVNSNYEIDLTAHSLVDSLDQRRGSVRLVGGNSLTLNSTSKVTGNLAVDGSGTWLVAEDKIHVREQGALAILNDALVNGTDVLVGDDIGGNASLSVGADSSTLHANNLLIGTPDGTTNGGQGEVTINGKIWLGDLPTDSDYVISIGSNVSPSNLVLRNGSKLNFDIANQVANSAYVAEQEYSIGNILISGVGSELDAPDQGLIFGYRGQANLTIEDEGVFNLHSLNAGFYEESVGNVLVTGNGSRLTTNYANIGWVYGTGSMTIIDGGAFEGDLDIGDLGGNGVVTVSGEDSRITSGELNVGTSYSPSTDNFSTGELHILDGAIVENSREFHVAEESTSTGIVLISGAGSTLFTDSVYMKSNGNEVAPADGMTSMTISAGSAVFVGDDIPAASDASLTISGEDAIFGRPKLYVGESAVLENDGDALLGYWFDQLGIAEVVGAGALWNNTGDLELGVNGTGEASVLENGTLMVGGITTINPDSSLVIDNGDFTSLGGIVNEGAIELRNGGNIRGDIEVLGGSLFSIAGDVHVHNEFLLDDRFAFNVIEGEVASITFHGNCFGISKILVSLTSAMETIRFAGGVNLPVTESDSITDWNGVDDVYLGPQSVLNLRIGQTNFGTIEADNISCENLFVENGAALSLTLTPDTTLEIGQQYTLVTQTDNSGAVAGPFAGLNEGDLVASFGGVNLFITYVAGDGNDIAVYTGGTRIVAPHVMTVTRGSLAAGGAQELSGSDNVDISIRRSNIDILSRTEFEVESQSTTPSPNSMEVRLEGSVFARNTVVQSIWMFDYSLNNWEEVDTSNASRFVDRIDVVALDGDLSRFVDQSNGRIKARVRFMSANPRQQFTSNTDSLIWRIGD